MMPSAADDARRQYSRYAAYHFGLCFLILIGSGLLDRAVSDAHSRYSQMHDLYRQAGERVHRLDAFIQKTPSAFHDIVEAGLYNQGWPDGRDAPYVQGADEFSEDAARIFAATADIDKRIRLLHESAARHFPKAITERLDKRQTLEEMAAMDTRERWADVASWIAFSRWPRPSGGYGGTVGIPSYSQRFLFGWRNDDERFWVHGRLLYARSLDEAHSVVVDSWKEASSQLKAIPHVAPSITVPVAGLAIGSDYLLFLGGPAILGSQLLFFLAWERRKATLNRDGLSEAPLFPSFGCLGDPVWFVCRNGLSAVPQVIIWAVFLTLAPAIFSLAVLTRYSLLDLYRGYFTISGTDDVLSTALDVGNLFCLGFSLLITLTITADDTRRSSPRFVRAAVRVPAVGCLLLSLFSLYWYQARTGTYIGRWDVLVPAGLWLGFSLVWSWALAGALVRKTPLVLVLSSIAVIWFIVRIVL